MSCFTQTKNEFNTLHLLNEHNKFSQITIRIGIYTMLDPIHNDVRIFLREKEKERKATIEHQKIFFFTLSLSLLFQSEKRKKGDRVLNFFCLN